MNEIEILVTKDNNSSEYADHVICVMCDKEMLVDIGTEICPKCGNEGCLSWADNEKPEAKIQDFTQSKQIINQKYFKRRKEK